MPCQASGSLRRIIWQIWTGKEGIFPWQNEPVTVIVEKNKSYKQNLRGQTIKTKLYITDAQLNW